MYLNIKKQIDALNKPNVFDVEKKYEKLIKDIIKYSYETNAEINYRTPELVIAKNSVFITCYLKEIDHMIEIMLYDDFERRNNRIHLYASWSTETPILVSGTNTGFTAKTFMKVIDSLNNDYKTFLCLHGITKEKIMDDITEIIKRRESHE